ncbi:MAG: ABC transporter ATP-binding protein [Candidatus Thorarchaeota archaeon]
MSTVLEVEQITKTYMLGKVPVEALRGVSFSVQQGEYISILGPSGSGKSTLLNMIGALDRPTSGRLVITGKDTSTADDNLLADLRQNVGFVFQFFNLIPRLDAIGNVELPLAIAGVGRKERLERAVKMLENVGLTDRMHHRPAELSGGERQRVAVARALVNNPQFILMDEPTGNLDSKTALEIMTLVRELNEQFGVTVIVVTHDQEIGRQASRTLRMRDGLIIAEEVN